MTKKFSSSFEVARMMMEDRLTDSAFLLPTSMVASVINANLINPKTGYPLYHVVKADLGNCVNSFQRCLRRYFLLKGSRLRVRLIGFTNYVLESRIMELHTRLVEAGIQSNMEQQQNYVRELIQRSNHSDITSTEINSDYDQQWLVYGVGNLIAFVTFIFECASNALQRKWQA